MNLEELIARHEGKTVEFKRDATSAGPILKTLSAFSNTAGGVLVIREPGPRRFQVQIAARQARHRLLIEGHVSCGPLELGEDLLGRTAVAVSHTGLASR